jgi:hypothetical protein
MKYYQMLFRGYRKDSGYLCWITNWFILLQGVDCQLDDASLGCGSPTGSFFCRAWITNWMMLLWGVDHQLVHTSAGRGLPTG